KDGGVFVFCLRSAPEMALLVQAQQKDGVTKWYYAYAPITEQPLQAILDNKDMWTSNRKRRTGREDPYFLPPTEPYAPIAPTTQETMPRPARVLHFPGG